METGKEWFDKLTIPSEIKGRLFLILLLILLIGICGTAEGADTGSFDYGNDNPDFTFGNRPEGIYTIISGTIDVASDYSWVVVLDRDGTDGGHLTVELDSSVSE
ncbi:MAG: hypothetical protein PHY02_01490 [Phycisphaerae bacterium]|nr:hypothetical protein [Phycisphaerae bacterium]